jgi:hypothetical protein
MPEDELRPFLGRARPDDTEAMNTRFDQASRASSAAALLGDAGSAGLSASIRARSGPGIHGKVRTMKHITGTNLRVASCVVLLVTAAALLAGKDDIRKFHRMRCI